MDAYFRQLSRASATNRPRCPGDSVWRKSIIRAVVSRFNRSRSPYAASNIRVTAAPSIAGFPAAFIGVLFTGALLIEVIFSLDGLGLLGFEAALNRDYPVMFATLYVFTLIGLVLGLIGDLTYMLIDPRIDFESREV